MSIARFLPTGWSWAIVIAVGLSFAGLVMAEQDAGASSPPPLTVSPHSNLTDGQTVAVSVAPNDYFAPHAAVHILECADPEGSVANLPKDDTTCDGNTIQGSTLLVGANGTFSDPSYPVYLLPNQQLGEQTNDQPICNQSHYCVLYVGLGQNDFTQPKVFSAPFLIAPSTATSTTQAGGGSAGTAASSSTTAAPTTSSVTAPGTAATTDPAVSVSGSSALANTGPPTGTAWVAVSATALLITGALGRRFALRRPR